MKTMKELWGRARAWAKRNTGAIVRAGVTLAAIALAGWKVRSFGSWAFVCAAWAAVTAVVRTIERRSPGAAA